MGGRQYFSECGIKCSPHWHTALLLCMLCRKAFFHRGNLHKGLILPLCSDNTQSDANTKEFWVNMPNLMTHLKKVSEQKPQATYYNVDMLKYQVGVFL